MIIIWTKSEAAAPAGNLEEDAGDAAESEHWSMVASLRGHSEGRPGGRAGGRPRVPVAR